MTRSTWPSRAGLGLLAFRLLFACGESTPDEGTPVVVATPTPTPTAIPSRACVLPIGGKTATLTWTASRESAVNRTGGGYRVYACDYSGFSLADAVVTDVPFVSGPSVPASVTLAGLGSGSVYVRVVAYSALNAVGSTAGSQSDASSQITVVVP